MPSIYAHHNSTCTRCGGAIVKNERMFIDGTRVWCKACVARRDDARARAAQQRELERYNVG